MANLVTLSQGGGMGTSRNRTFWPTLGGALAFQPGWFQGHDKATIYVNLGFGTDGPDNGPKNMSFPMVPPFGLLGPSKGPYPGTVCLPQVPLPANTVMNPGDNATIQVVELAQHGAALYSVSVIEPNPASIPVPIFFFGVLMRLGNSVLISPSPPPATRASATSTRPTASTAPTSASPISTPSRPRRSAPSSTRRRRAPRPL